MSGYQEYKCAVCGFEWQALEKGECPQCVTRKDAAPSTYPSAAEWRAARDRGDAFRDALCNLRECAHGTCWRMPGEIGMADMSVAEYIDTVLAAQGDGAVAAPKRDVPTHAEMFHALELAWGLIANASGGDWAKESREWQDAAARWRDEQFYGLIRRFGGHAQARLGACNAPDDETGFTTFGTPKWRLLCGCSADANDNRVWCSLHGQARFGVPGTPDEATRLRDLLARALPVLKHVAVDGSSEAEALVGEVQGELAGAPGAPIRDWTEDAAHENGNYENRCIACGHHFKGHKRRIWCKVCAQSTPAPAPSASELALRADVARLRGALATVAVAPIDGVDAYTSLCCVRNCARDALAATAHGAPGRGESAEEGTAP